MISKVRTLIPVMTPLTEIKPYANNPRKNSKSVEKVRKSIREFGVTNPIALDADGYIIYGHTRYQAAVEEGLEAYPCVTLDDLTPEQTRLYRIADNSVGEESEWDGAKLAIEFESLKGTSFDHLPLLDLGLDEYLPASMFEPAASKDVSFKAKEGAKEMSESDFESFKHQCPRCGFEYNGKEK